MSRERRPVFFALYGVTFFLLFLVTVLNVDHLSVLWRESKTR